MKNCYHSITRPLRICKIRKYLTSRYHHKVASLEESGEGELSKESRWNTDLNRLHTELTHAVEAEDFQAAAKIRDEIQSRFVDDNTGNSAGQMGWVQLGILEWLAERAESLGYQIPTLVQSRAAQVLGSRHDCVIHASTGSGKTLAFLLPLLSILEYPPLLYPEDLDGPQLLIVVPTRELGVQIAMLVFKLFGGSVNSGIPGQRSNMFRYFGPKGLKVRGLLMPDEVERSVEEQYLSCAHVVVGTPDLIVQALKRGVEVSQHALAVCVDEVDACYQAYPGDLDYILSSAVRREKIHNSGARDAEKGVSMARPIVVLSGASIVDSLIDHAEEKHWIEHAVEVSIGEKLKLPSSVVHEYVLVQNASDKIGAMCRCVLGDLKDQNPDSQPPRAIVFVDSAEAAKSLAEPLRNIFWGKHSISILLPDGAEPIHSLHAFRDNQASLLVATPAASRGLDLPAVTHVYSMYPPHSKSDYLHMAGRMGRIGYSSHGIMTTMLQPDQVDDFKCMLKELGCESVCERKAPLPPSLSDLVGQSSNKEDLEDAKRSLEAILALSPENNADSELPDNDF
jgi:superfamily II DNA/RNA helicase